MERAIVTTSIFGLTDEIAEFAELDGWDVIYVSDRKTPDFEVDRDDFIHLTCERQEDMDLPFVGQIEWNRFQRKNIGYLYAIREGYDRIADVDDDNMPDDRWGDWLDNEDTGNRVVGPKYPNMYSIQCSANIWPRGMPLDELHNRDTKIAMEWDTEIDQPAVVQGYVDGDPDVDAICRMATLPSEPDVSFNEKRPYVMSEGAWTQFNAQNTLWDDEDVFPLMYLPCSVTMRVCDILRSYVAQRIMWEHDLELAFGYATVYQDRNDHDLMVDFNDELANYQDVKDWVRVLESTDLSGDSPTEDLKTCYTELVIEGLVDRSEMGYLNAWLNTL